MSSAQPSEDPILLPQILVQSASPRGPEKPSEEDSVPPAQLQSTTDTSPSQTLQVPRRSGRKRTATEASLSSSDSDIESEMGNKKDSEHSSKKQHSSSSKSKPKANKTDEWADVTDPEERRRIQNRIAQRKFREKTREQRERAERESQNQENAGSAYHIPEPDDLSPEQDMSGLPWGTFSMRHVVARGRQHQSQQSSGRGEYLREDAQRHQAQASSYEDTYGYSAGAYQPHAASYGGSSAGDDPYYDDQNAYYPEYDQDGNPTQPQYQQGDFFTDQFKFLGGWPDVADLGSSPLPYDTQDLYY